MLSRPPEDRHQAALTRSSPCWARQEEEASSCRGCFAEPTQLRWGLS